MAAMLYLVVALCCPVVVKVKLFERCEGRRRILAVMSLLHWGASPSILSQLKRNAMIAKAAGVRLRGSASLLHSQISRTSTHLSRQSSASSQVLSPNQAPG